MGDITIKSLFREDLQRFKMARDKDCTLAGVRSKLENQHKGMLPQNFVIKYEWGEWWPRRLVAVRVWVRVLMLCVLGVQGKACRN